MLFLKNNFNRIITIVNKAIVSINQPHLTLTLNLAFSQMTSDQYSETLRSFYKRGSTRNVDLKTKHTSNKNKDF